MTGGVIEEMWRSPLARFTVHTRSVDGRSRFDGAVGAAGVVWHQTAPAGRSSEMRAARHPDSVAAVLAQLIGLGPRPAGPAASGGVDLTWTEVESVARRGGLHVVLWRSGDDQEERTALVVVDADGFSLAVPADEVRRYRLQPVSPPMLWAELCSLIGRLDPGPASEPDRDRP